LPNYPKNLKCVCVDDFLGKKNSNENIELLFFIDFMIVEKSEWIGYCSFIYK
tara:strand:+ start:129017 stop:129172 length:156 start_codon:yes stop_codon:yes gene_type:complete